MGSPTTTQSGPSGPAVTGGAACTNGCAAVTTMDAAGAEAGSVFAELVCADPEWLEREFAALIAANFPPSDPDETPHRIPPQRPVAAATAGQPSHARPEPAAPRPRPPWWEHESRQQLPRERSPPGSPRHKPESTAATPRRR